MNGIFTWTFKGLRKIGIAGAMALAISGCSGLGAATDSAAPVAQVNVVSQTEPAVPPRRSSFLGGLFSAAPKSALTRQTVAKGAVVIAAPQGYCIDSKGSRPNRGGFVMLASCASLIGDAALPARNTLLTASVAQGPGPSSDGYSRFFNTPQGRAALSQSGDTDVLTVTQTTSRNGLFLIHAIDKSLPDENGLSSQTWRAFFDLNGQIVSLTAFGLEAQPISVEGGFALLDGFATLIRDASPQQAQTAVISAPVEATDGVARGTPFAD